MKLAVIGGGVVGLCYAQAFAKTGIPMVGICDPHPTSALLAFAEAQDLSVHAQPGPWLGEASGLISAVYGSASLAVARLCIPFLPVGALYVDMTTADPGDMVNAASLATEAGQHFVDVAITGAVNLQGSRTPLLCAGTEAETAAALYRRIDAPIAVVGESPGDASTLKLLRSIFTKGLEALVVECLVTAETHGLREPLHRVLADIDAMPLQKVMESLIMTHVPHAARRRNEVIEAQRQMRLAGIDSVMLPAACAVFDRTLARASANPLEDTETTPVLRWLIESARLEPDVG